MLKNLSICFFIPLVLCACQSGFQTTPEDKPLIIPDVKAIYNKPSDIAPKVVTKYVPVPLPGQLMPAPSVTDKKGSQATKMPEFSSKEKAVAYANKQALTTPKSSDFFNAMMTYDYTPGAVYVIYTAPMRITDVTFSPGEKIISEAAGDTLRWQLAQSYSGQGPSLRYHLFIKPNASGIENTVIVTTNKRVYHLLLKSTTDNTYMVSVKWHYPDDMVTFTPNTADHSDSALGEGTSNQMAGLDLSTLNFNYGFGMVTGQRPAWYPVRVFSSNRQTFIEFSPQFASGNLPVLYVADNNGRYNTMVNWRLKGRWMVIDGLFTKARLQTGVKTHGQTIVQIEKT